MNPEFINALLVLAYLVFPLLNSILVLLYR